MNFWITRFLFGLIIFGIGATLMLLYCADFLKAIKAHQIVGADGAALVMGWPVVFAVVGLFIFAGSMMIKEEICHLSKDLKKLFARE